MEFFNNFAPRAPIAREHLLLAAAMQGLTTTFTLYE